MIMMGYRIVAGAISLSPSKAASKADSLEIAVKSQVGSRAKPQQQTILLNFEQVTKIPLCQ